MKTNTKLAKKDLFRANWRWFRANQLPWNYEKMMAPGYFYTVLPFLKRLYQDDELVDMMKMHSQLFDTNAFTSPFIIGMDLAIEEHQGYKAKETVAGIKTRLMGPLAGVGGTIFGVIIPTICGSIGAYVGLKGNALGAIIWLLVNIFILFAGFAILPIGHYQREKLINSAEGKLNAVTDSAILLGVTVVGALVPTVIKADVPFIFSTGETTLKLQAVLNQIMPPPIPVLLVAFVYWLLGRKRMTSTKVILFVLVLGIVLSYFRILGA